MLLKRVTRHVVVCCRKSMWESGLPSIGVKLLSSSRPSSSFTGWIRGERYFCWVVVWHSYNVSHPSYRSSFVDFLNIWLTVVLRKLVVLSSPPYANFTYSAENRSMHKSFVIRHFWTNICKGSKRSWAFVLETLLLSSFKPAHAN